MAQMNEVFMKGVSQKALEIFRNTGLTKVAFCKKLEIPNSYLSALETEKNWSRIPAWAWFFFQDLTNRKIEFNGIGEIIYLHDGHTLEELHEDCKCKAEQRALKEKKTDTSESKVTKRGLVLPLSSNIEQESIGSMMIGTVANGHEGVRYATEDDLNDVVSYMMDMADIIAEVNKDELTRILKLRKNLIKWQTKKKL